MVNPAIDCEQFRKDLKHSYLLIIMSEFMLSRSANRHLFDKLYFTMTC